MSSLKEQVGALVRHHRKRLGWSQDQLATQAERSVEMINRIERGRIAPSFDTLEALSQALSVPVRDFFGVGPHAASSTADTPMARLIGRVAALDPADLNWIDDVVRIALSRKTARSSVR